MAWYEGTYSCGHEGRVNIIGPTKDRQRKVDYHFSGLCDACAEKERQAKIEEENKKAALETREMELPELQGTEKQVPWANTLRVKFAKEMEELIKWTSDNAANRRWVLKKLIAYEIKRAPQSADISWFIEEILQYSLREKTSASYWINHRDLEIYERIAMLADERDERNPDKDVPKTILAEATVAPNKVEHTGIVKIVGDDTYIKAYYEKNEEFRLIVKKHGYSWNGVWKRELNEFTGSFCDRAAELGNDLLRNGFTIQIIEPEALKNAVSGKFEPECNRWIKLHEPTGKLVLRWPKDEKSGIYENSLKIPGATWDSGRRGVVVKVEFYREVVDFAECYGFRFSKAAKAYVDQYVEEESKIERVIPETPEKKIEIDKLKEKLKSSGAIIADLMDGD